MKLLGFTIRREATATQTSTASRGVSVRSNLVSANKDNALQVAAMYRAIDLRSQTFARARYEANRIVGGVRRPITDIAGADFYRHLEYLLNVRPNNRMTASQMWRRAQYLRDTEGRAAIYIVRNKTDVFSLIPCRIDTYNYTENTYNLTSREFNTSWADIPATEVIVLRGLPTENYLQGLSLVKAASRTLSLNLTAENLCTKVYAKGGTFKAIVKQEQQASPLEGLDGFDDQEMKDNVADVQHQFDNDADLVYDPSCADFNIISQSFQDLTIDAQTTKAVEQISRFCGVPLPLMFCSTNAVYKSIDDAWHTFRELTIRPMWIEVVEQLCINFVPEEQYQTIVFSVNTDNLCLDSDSSKAQTASTRVNAGLTTQNEERVNMGLAPVEGGDTLRQPQQTTTNNKEGGEE